MNLQSIKHESRVDAMSSLRFNLKSNVFVANASFQEFDLDWMRFVVQVCNSKNGVWRKWYLLK